MNMFHMTNFQTINEPPVWLWIYRDKEMELIACYFVEHIMFTTNYVKKYSSYEPTKFKRLEDL